MNFSSKLHLKLRVLAIIIQLNQAYLFFWFFHYLPVEAETEKSDYYTVSLSLYGSLG